MSKTKARTGKQGPVCPRCGHYIPDDATPGLYPGALSRWDNETEVCSACGLDEAMRDFIGEPLDRAEWFDKTKKDPRKRRPKA